MLNHHQQLSWIAWRALTFIFPFLTAIVIGAFLSCYLPIVVASLVHIYSGETSFPSLGKALEILLFLTFLNTVLNPMIYSLRNNDYRKAFKRIFRTHTRESTGDRRLRVNCVTQELESLTVSSLVTSSHVNTSWNWRILFEYSELSQIKKDTFRAAVRELTHKETSEIRHSRPARPTTTMSPEGEGGAHLWLRQSTGRARKSCTVDQVTISTSI